MELIVLGVRGTVNFFPADENIMSRGLNRGMQIRRSVVFFGPIRQSDVIFVQIRIRSSEMLVPRDFSVQPEILATAS